MHGADYVIEHRTLQGLHAANIPLAPGTIDLRDYPQQSPQAVIEIMIQLAVANKIEPDLLGHVLLGALRISPRTPGGTAELGSYPVPAGIEPAYAAALLERAGIGGITEESLRCGVDAGYYGGKRLHAISNHSTDDGAGGRSNKNNPGRAQKQRRNAGRDTAARSYTSNSTYLLRTRRRREVR